MSHPKYNVRLLKAAEEDFKEAITYIALDNPSAAEATANKIEKSLSNLAAHPFLGKVPDEAELAGLGYRFVVVQNYIIFYTIEDNVILVHRIIHGARDYLSLL